MLFHWKVFLLIVCWMSKSFKSKRKYLLLNLKTWLRFCPDHWSLSMLVFKQTGEGWGKAAVYHSSPLNELPSYLRIINFIFNNISSFSVINCMESHTRYLQLVNLGPRRWSNKVSCGLYCKHILVLNYGHNWCNIIWSVILGSSRGINYASRGVIAQAIVATAINYNYNTFIVQATGPLSKHKHGNKKLIISLWLCSSVRLLNCKGDGLTRLFKYRSDQLDTIVVLSCHGPNAIRLS